MSWKSGSLNLLEPFGPRWACYGAALPFFKIKYAFWFSVQNFFSNISHSKKISKKYYHTFIHTKYPLFLSDFHQIWNFATNFRKTLKYKIPRKSVLWEPSCTKRKDGRTDKHDDTNSRFVFQFCKSSWKRQLSEPQSFTMCWLHYEKTIMPVCMILPLKLLNQFIVQLFFIL